MFFANPKITLSEFLPPSVIPFWKPLMTLYLDPNSDAKILQKFCTDFCKNFLQKFKSKSGVKTKFKVQCQVKFKVEIKV